MKITVVDLETTGLDPLYDRVIEIGFIFIEDGIEISRYSQLFNPAKTIPVNITTLTGISSKMVEKSPVFESLAAEIDQMTKGYILVGHHIQFDYSFLKNEMRQAGFPFSRKTLCTAELARMLLPNKKSHSLKSICSYYSVINHHPHRALSDATATAEVFIAMEKQLGEPFLNSLLKRKNASVAASIDFISEIVKKLPKTTGIYYFIGANEKPIYIGKAKNIKSRVLSHFRGDGNSLQLLAITPFTKDIKYVETGSLLLASLYEDHEIRHYWPRFNRAQKVNNKKFGVVIYTDMKNRWRMGITKFGKTHCFQIYFHQYHLAESYIRNKIDQYKLNSTFCGIGVQNEVPTNEAEHNINFERMILESEQLKKVELYFTEGRSMNEKGFLLIENGIYKGIGFVEATAEITLDLINEKLMPRYSSITVENILKKLIGKVSPDLILSETETKTISLEQT